MATSTTSTSEPPTRPSSPPPSLPNHTDDKYDVAIDAIPPPERAARCTSPTSSAEGRNSYPATDEIEELKVALAEARTSHSLLDAEFDRLKQAIQEIEIQRTRQHRQIVGLARSLTPIRNLPMETLLEIFRCCVSHTDHLVESVNRTPLRLGLVCRHWREVALSSKGLWIHLDVNLDLHQDVELSTSNAHNSNILKAYLERSDPNPLFVTVYGHRLHCAPKHPLLELLASRSHRWCSAGLFLSPGYYADGGVLDLITNNQPLLERLSLGVGGDVPISTAHFASCPKLSNLTINGSLLGTSPWTQLTELRHNQAIAGDLLEIIKLSPQLIALFVLEVSHDARGEVLGPIISNIEIIGISIFNPSCGTEKGMTSLLDGLTLPCLESLALRCSPELNLHRLGTRIDIASFIRRSNCPLKQLILRNIPIADTDLIKALHLLPTLTTLIMDEVYSKHCECPNQQHLQITKKLLDALEGFTALDSEEEPVPRVLPLLSNLSLTISDEPGDEWYRSLISMVDSRRRPRSQVESDAVECLQSLELQYPHGGLKAFWMGYLYTMEIEGMILDISRCDDEPEFSG